MMKEIYLKLFISNNVGNVITQVRIAEADNTGQYWSSAGPTTAVFVDCLRGYSTRDGPKNRIFFKNIYDVDNEF